MGICKLVDNNGCQALMEYKYLVSAIVSLLTLHHLSPFFLPCVLVSLFFFAPR
jgi:hypothetical protein